MESPFLDVLPDLVPDVSPISDPSLNLTPAQDSVRVEYFPLKDNSKSALHHDLPLRPNVTRSTITSQVQGQKKTSTYSPISINKLLGQDLNPTNEIFNTGPFAPSAEGPCFANPIQAFWYHKISPPLSDLLMNASYSSKIRDQYIDFFNHSIIPALGPVVSTEAKWKSRLTHAKSPFEPSWNMYGQDQTTPKQQVCFAFESIGPLAGTEEDPFNQLVPSYFVSSLAGSNVCQNLELSWWQHFAAEFFVTSADTRKESAHLLANCDSPTCFLAFDLPTDEFAPVVKAYLFPSRRALLERKTTTEVILSAVKKLDSPSLSILPAIKTVEAFLSTSSEYAAIRKAHNSSNPEQGNEETLELLSFDCVHLSQAPRLKLYLKTYNTSLDNVEYIYTLAGERASDETDAALVLFKQLWECLTGLEGEWRNSEEQTTSFLYFGLEIIPGQEVPDIKIYVPAWTCGITESGMREGLSNFFLARGWGIGEEYEKFGAGLTHTYLSFSYSEEEGVSVTMYYSPLMAKL